MFVDKTCWFANETEYNIAKNERLTCLVKNGRIAEPTEILFYIANGLVLFILFLGISYLIFKYFTKVYRRKLRVNIALQFFPLVQKLNLNSSGYFASETST